MSEGTIDLDELEKLAKEFTDVGKQIWHSRPPADFSAILEVLKDEWRPERVDATEKCGPTKKEVFPHLQQLLDWGKVRWEELQQQDTIFEPSPFYVREKSNGTETRPIWAAVPSNLSMEDPFDLQLPQMGDTIDWAFEGTPDGPVMGVSIDMVGWFGQIPMKGRYLRIRLPRSMARKEHLVWVVLPQGWKWSPVLAQRISEVILSNLSCAKAIIYDNFLLTGPPDILSGQVEELRLRCARIGAKINIQKSTPDLKPAHSCTHCGAELSFNDASFRMEEKWAQKVTPIMEKFGSAEALTFDEVFTAAGLMIWYLNVKRIPLAHYRPVISAMRLIGRRVNRGSPWSSTFTVSPSLRAAFRTIAAALRLNHWTKWTPKCLIKYRIHCDASDIGYSWCVVDSEKREVIVHEMKLFGRDEELTNIADREMKALSEALEWARRHDLRGIHAFVDNSVVVNVVKKGHSSREYLDAALREILIDDLTITWIPSDLNPADLASRGINWEQYIGLVPTQSDMLQLLVDANELPTHMTRWRKNN